MDRLGLDQMLVIEDETKVARDKGNLVNQGRNSRLNWWWLGRVEEGQRGLPDSGIDRLKRSDEVGEEARRVVVVFLQRNPGCGPFTS